MLRTSLSYPLAGSLALAALSCGEARPPAEPHVPFAASSASLSPGAGYLPGWSIGERTSVAAPPIVPVPNAVSVVDGMRPAFHRCYQAGLNGEDPDMTGSIRVTAKVDAYGRVSQVASSLSAGPHTLTPKVVACIEQVVAGAQFSPPQGGGATIIIPITFVTRDEAGDAGAPAPHP